MRTLAGKHLGAVRSELAAADVPGTLRPSAAKWRGMCKQTITAVLLDLTWPTASRELHP